MSEFDRGWNAAIDVAAESVTKAPVFPKKDYGGPRMDAERLTILEACRKQVLSLRKGKP